jgi:hypothetical protein
MEDHDLWPLVNGSKECENDRCRPMIVAMLLRKSEVSNAAVPGGDFPGSCRKPAPVEGTTP